MAQAATPRQIRPMAVAGSFYPSEPDALRAMIARQLDAARRQSEAAGANASSDPQAGPETDPEAGFNTGPMAVPRAIIAPHAGYVYSGPVAATAYARIEAARSEIRRVVLIGPAHRVPVIGLATCGVDAFQTPLGNVTLDRPAIDDLCRLPFVNIYDAAHAPEHSIEVHLPFLQTVLDDFTLVPLAMGEVSPRQIEAVFDQIWDGHETLIVVSSDLSHFHTYEAARRLDTATSRAIVELDPSAIASEQACGHQGIQALLAFAKRRDMAAQLLDQRSSGDTAGPRDSVVGYGAYALQHATS